MGDWREPNSINQIGLQLVSIDQFYLLKCTTHQRSCREIDLMFSQVCVILSTGTVLGMHAWSQVPSGMDGYTWSQVPSKG